VITDEPPRLNGRGVSVDDIEVQLLLEGLVQHTGYDFRSYDPSVIKRRVERALSAEGLRTISELQGQALHDDACLARVLKALARRQISMFGEPALFRDVRTTIVPLLRTYPFLRIWNAGCSTGEDAYALAIILEEAGIYARCRIYATGANRDLIDGARAGSYDPESMAEWQQNYAASGGTGALSDYVRIDGGAARIDAQLRRNIVFAHHNIVSDVSFNEFHLIFCPGLLIQFNMELQSRVHGVLYASLIRLGFLAVGKDESIAASPYAQAYRRVDTDSTIYRRAG